MGYYRICENCGAHLDPGERCDCESKEAWELRAREEAREAKAEEIPQRYGIMGGVQR